MKLDDIMAVLDDLAERWDSESEDHNEYDMGYATGYEDGYREGHDSGYTEAAMDR